MTYDYLSVHRKVNFGCGFLCEFFFYVGVMSVMSLSVEFTSVALVVYGDDRPEIGLR